MTPALIPAYAEVYTVAEAVTAWDGHGYPAGASVRAWRAVDGLKAAAAPARDVGRAEQIALTIEWLHLALRQPAARRAQAARTIKLHIEKLGRDWLGGLPMALSR